MASKFPGVQTQRESEPLDTFLFFYSEGIPLASSIYSIMNALERPSSEL